MAESMNRRSFLKGTAWMGAAALAAGGCVSRKFAEMPVRQHVPRHLPDPLGHVPLVLPVPARRSEERRVGKEC